MGSWTDHPRQDLATTAGLLSEAYSRARLAGGNRSNPTLAGRDRGALVKAIGQLGPARATGGPPGQRPFGPGIRRESCLENRSARHASRSRPHKARAEFISA